MIIRNNHMIIIVVIDGEQKRKSHMMQMSGWKGADSLRGQGSKPVIYTGMMDCFRQTVKAEGFSALFHVSHLFVFLSSKYQLTTSSVQTWKPKQKGEKKSAANRYKSVADLELSSLYLEPSILSTNWDCHANNMAVCIGAFDRVFQL